METRKSLWIYRGNGGGGGEDLQLCALRIMYLGVVWIIDFIISPWNIIILKKNKVQKAISISFRLSHGFFDIWQ